MSEEKTHYRKAFNSPYLSAADITEPTKLTIKCVSLEPDKTNKTKDKFNTAYFSENEIRKGEILKPMILNVSNSKVMKCFADSAWIDDWNNIPVTIYVDPNVRFGRDTVEGLRISPEQPNIDKPELTPGTKAWDNALLAYKRDTTFEAIEKRMQISEENKQRIRDESNY